MPKMPKGVDALPSGGFRARFTFAGRRYTNTLDSPKAAASWMARTRSELVAGTYVDPDTMQAPASAPLLRDYAAQWVRERELKPRTRSEYTRMLGSLAPLDAMPLDRITREDVKAWFSGLTLASTARKHVYEMVRAIMNSAVDDELRDTNPVRIKGAARPSRRPLTDLPSAVQVHALADAMPSQKYRVMVLVSAWCGLRFGESTELRRKDVLLGEDDEPLAIKVRRGVVRVDGEYIVGTPKSSAGVRDVVIPPHIRSEVAEYLDTLPAASTALMFPGTRNGRHMAPSSLYRPFYRARAVVGLPALRWHDLRHFSATAAAQSGATLAELQSRLGHSTVAAAIRYQHVARGRDAAVAEAMSSNVVELRPAREA